MISKPLGSVLNSCRVQGYRHKVQRPNEIRGKIFLQLPTYGTKDMHYPLQKTSWGGCLISNAYCLFKAQPGNLSWFEVTGKWWGSNAGGLVWAARSPTGRRIGQQEGEGSDAEHGEMSAALFTSFLQASFRTDILFCCIQKSPWRVLCVISQMI